MKPPDSDEPAARAEVDRATFRVALPEAGITFDAAADATILASAEAAGVSLLSSCRAGTCRTCMRRLVSGAVVYRMEWPGLLAEEKAEGWILPCVAYPASDLVMR